jgi:hypothetical protein
MTKRIRQPVSYTLPCCNTDIKVTGRPAKQRERGRYHKCNGCGRLYLVNAADGKVTNCKEA